MALTCIYIAAILFAFLSSLKSFRLDFPFHLKIFSILLGLTFLVELYSALIVRIVHVKNNYWIYNAFTLVEFWAYGYYYRQLIRLDLFRKIILFFLLLFPIFWLVTVCFVFGFNNWNSYVIVAGSFFTILFAVMYYYQVLLNREIQSLRNLPEFWIATGMLIFYIGCLPYYGTLNFLWTFHKSAARTLWKVLLIMDTIMYVLFSYGYLCRTTNTKKS